MNIVQKSCLFFTIVGVAGLVNIMLFFVDLDELTVLETPKARAR